MASTVAGKPPQNEWPTFILDLGADKDKDVWTIRFFAEVNQNDPSFWDSKLGVFKYSAISYAWGDWRDYGTEIERTDKINTNYPAFHKDLEKITWTFPAMKNNNTPQALFTIDDIHNVFKKLGTRYIWWDWACNAQGKDSDLKKKAFTNPYIPQAGGPKNLLQLQAVEVDKMKTVYSRSFNGCLWMHQTTFVEEPKGKTASQPVKGALQEVLETQTTIALCQRPLEDKAGNLVPGFDNYDEVLIRKFADQLTEVLKTQASIGSVWSFQEGVLFGHPSRPQRLVSSNGQSPASTCLILDHNGKSFTKTASGNPADYIQDISATATGIVAIMALTLLRRQKGQDIGLKANKFVQWCFDSKNDAQVRALLSQMIASGSVGYLSGSPLLLLEAKFARGVTAKNCEADKTVRAMIGAMDIDYPNDILIQGREAKANWIESLKQNDPNMDRATEKREGDKAECPVIQTPYIDLLVARYQWRLFIHARGEDNTLTAQTTGGASWWKWFANVTSPPMASLDYYIGENALYLYYLAIRNGTATSYEFKSIPKLAVAKDSKGVIPDRELPIIAKPNDKFSEKYLYYDLSQSNAPAWTACWFYEFMSRDPKDKLSVPGTVNLANVAFADRAKKFGNASILLFPFQTLEELTPMTRCFIFSGFDAAKGAATFRGVGDFAGLSKSSLVAFTKDLTIW